MRKQRVTPFLSFTGNAEEAMRFYTSVFPGAQISTLVHFGKGHSHGDEGKVLSGNLSFMGQNIAFMDMAESYPAPKFSWASSLLIDCSDEAEFDAIFGGLSQDGVVMMGPEPVEKFRKVTWITDKFGVTWQMVWE